MITATNYLLLWGALLSKTLVFIYLFIFYLFIYSFIYLFIYLLFYLFIYFIFYFLFIYLSFLGGEDLIISRHWIHCKILIFICWSWMFSKAFACRLKNVLYMERKLFYSAIYLNISNVSARNTVLKNPLLQSSLYYNHYNYNYFSWRNFIWSKSEIFDSTIK